MYGTEHDYYWELCYSTQMAVIEAWSLFPEKREAIFQRAVKPFTDYYLSSTSSVLSFLGDFDRVVFPEGMSLNSQGDFDGFLLEYASNSIRDLVEGFFTEGFDEEFYDLLASNYGCHTLPKDHEDYMPEGEEAHFDGTLREVEPLPDYMIEYLLIEEPTYLDKLKVIRLTGYENLGGEDFTDL